METARKAFSFDANRCTGCQACELACTIENGLEDFSWRQVSTFNAERHPEAPSIHLSMACNHCADAPCMKHCPALAYTQDPQTGIVTLHADRCIGCRYCSWACPYDAPKFDAPQGVMTKCTFCSHRQAEGLEPACVVQCPTGALGFGEFDALEGEASMIGVPTVEPEPSIRFQPWHGRSPEPCDGPKPSSESPAVRDSKISLRSEWPLWAFTLMGTALVAAVASSAAAGPRLSLPLFGVAAVVSMALSSLHLGQKLRAWRAMLNLRHSWLSREIFFYSGFVGLGSLHLVFPEFQALAWTAATVGFAALFSIDRVYDLVLRHEPWRPHSADVVLTGLLGTALLLASPPLVLFSAGVKLGLYLVRKWRFARRGWPIHRGWSLLRLTAGLVLPCGLAIVEPEHWRVWSLVGVVVGEAIDRGEFYSELRVPTPATQMASSLERLLSVPLR